MSAEGKKKRGEGGVSNAANNGFRYTGGGAYPGHYAGTMRSVGGMIEKIGRPRVGSAFDKPVMGLTYAEATARERSA